MDLRCILVGIRMIKYQVSSNRIGHYNIRFTFRSGDFIEQDSFSFVFRQGKLSLIFRSLFKTEGFYNRRIKLGIETDGLSRYD